MSFCRDKTRSLSTFERKFQTAGLPVARSLKDKETDCLARAVAALTDETLADTIRKVLSERLERETLRHG